MVWNFVPGASRSTLNLVFRPAWGLPRFISRFVQKAAVVHRACVWTIACAKQKQLKRNLRVPMVYNFVPGASAAVTTLSSLLPHSYPYSTLTPVVRSNFSSSDSSSSSSSKSSSNSSSSSNFNYSYLTLPSQSVQKAAIVHRECVWTIACSSSKSSSNSSSNFSASTAQPRPGTYTWL